MAWSLRCLLAAVCAGTANAVVIETAAATTPAATCVEAEVRGSRPGRALLQVKADAAESRPEGKTRSKADWVDVQESLPDSSTEFEASKALDVPASISDESIEFEAPGDNDSPESLSDGLTDMKDSETFEIPESVRRKIGLKAATAVDMPESEFEGSQAVDVSEVRTRVKASQAGDMPESPAHGETELETSPILEAPNKKSWGQKKFKDSKTWDTQESLSDTITKAKDEEAVGIPESLSHGKTGFRVSEAADMPESLAHGDNQFDTSPAIDAQKKMSKQHAKSKSSKKSQSAKAKDGKTNVKASDTLDDAGRESNSFTPLKNSEADEPVTLHDGLERGDALDAETQLKMDISNSAAASDDMLDEQKGSEKTGHAASRKSDADVFAVRAAEGCPEYRCGHIEFHHIDNKTRRCIGKATAAHGGIGADIVLQKHTSFDCVSFLLPSAGTGPLVDYSVSPPLCLTIARNEYNDGNNVYYQPCRGEYEKGDSAFAAAPDQSFILPSDDMGPIRSTLFPDKCFNVEFGNTTVGHRVQLWTCGVGGGDNERFHLPSFESY